MDNNSYKNTMSDILIPCYNGGKTIEKLVNRIYQLNCPSNLILSVTIIDDGSIDDSFAIISQLKTKFTDLKIIKNEENHGLVYNRCFFLNQSNADYVLFIDDDDDVEDNIFEEFNKKLGYDLVRMVREFITPKKNYIKFKKLYEEVSQPIDLVTKFSCLNYITGVFISKFVYKKMIIILNNLSINIQNLNMREDLYFSYLAINFCRNFSFIKSLYRYYYNDSGLSLSTKKEVMYSQSMRIWNVLDETVKLLKKYNFYNIPVDYTKINLWYLLWVESDFKKIKVLHNLLMTINLHTISKLNFKNKLKTILLKNYFSYLLISILVKPFLTL